MNKKKIMAVTGLCASILLVGGCGKIPKMANGNDAVVTFKDDQKIDVNDLYNELKDKYALQSLVNMIDKHILESEFSDSVESAKSQAEATVKAMEQQYGDKSKLLQAIQYYTGFSTIEAYQDYLYLNQLQEKAALEYAKTQITDKEIKKYYESDIVGDIEVSHILITSDVKDGATDEEKTTAENEAKEKVQDIINQLNDAKNNNEDIKEKFTSLAKEYSKDDATKDKGGSLGKINKDTLGSAYDELVSAAYKLKDGEYSTSVITTELGYEVIYRTNSYDKASLEDSKDKIVTTLAEKLMTDDATVAVNALKHFRELYKTEIQDSELQKQYDSYLKNSLSSAAKSNESK